MRAAKLMSIWPGGRQTAGASLQYFVDKLVARTRQPRLSSTRSFGKRAKKLIPILRGG